MGMLNGDIEQCPIRCHHSRSPFKTVHHSTAHPPWLWVDPPFPMQQDVQPFQDLLWRSWTLPLDSEKYMYNFKINSTCSQIYFLMKWLVIQTSGISTDTNTCTYYEKTIQQHTKSYQSLHFCQHPIFVFLGLKSYLFPSLFLLICHLLTFLPFFTFTHIFKSN